MAPRLHGKSWEASGAGEGSAGARGWEPLAACLRPLHSALVGVRGGGAGGAALTSLRAVPAREGGAESCSEPGEAAYRQEPPNHSCFARLPRLSAVRPPGQGCLESGRSRA